MEKMIAVINDNLRNVVNGIKEHKSDLEISLNKIKKDMQTKIQEANSYKDEVENSRVIISALEQDIANLENDLIELTKKFDSKDFKEILSAGNKEINAKIIEKRSQISEQSRMIIDLTEKAKMLKDELIQLKTRKKNTEVNLHKTTVLETYFDLRINEIIEYSESHVEDLDSYIETIPQNELISEDISMEDLDAVIDGKVFEEIDSISSSEPDEDLLKSALANPEALATDTEEKAIAKIEEIKVLSEDEQIDNAIEDFNLAVSTNLEKLIDEAKMLIERNAELAEQQKMVEQPEEVKEEVEPTVLVLEEKVGEPVVEEIVKQTDALSEDNIQAAISFDDDVETKEDTLVINPSIFEEERNEEPVIFEDKREEVINNEIIADIPFAEKNEEPTFANSLIMNESMFNGTSSVYLDGSVTVDDAIELDDDDYEDVPLNPNLVVDFNGNKIDLENIEEEDPRSIHERLSSHQMSEPEIQVPFTLEPEINEDELTFADVPKKEIEESVDTSFIDEVEDEEEVDRVSLELDEIGLDKGLFSPADIDRIEQGFELESARKFIRVLDKYGVNRDIVYTDANIFLNVVPEHLDQLLSLLSKTGMNGEDVKYIYSVLDKININKLEQTIMTSDEPELTSSIYESAELEERNDLAKILGISDEDVESIRSHATGNDFELLKAFPEIAKANYEQITKLNVDNDIDCITKYPHRFTFAPSKFYAILDKYDTDDLIRCINKNAAVIDKL